MQIVPRLKLPHKCLKRRVERSTVEISKIAGDRPVRYPANRQAGAARGGERSAGHYGEITVPASKFAERIAGVRAAARDQDRFDQFMGATSGRHHSREERLSGDAATTPSR